MTQTPLLSVGLFVYNGERFIEEAVDSIVNQTFTDLELIISDNASTDRTGEIAKAYARHDHRIRYHRNEKNLGPGRNAQLVYELARGKYFKWASVDDLLEPDHLRRCVEVLENDPGCVLAYASTREVDLNGNFIKNYVTPMKVDSNDPVVRFGEMLLIHCYCYQIYGVMRRSDLCQVPPQGIYVNGDRVLLARMSMLGRFYEVPEHLFISRHHSGQSIRTRPKRLNQPRRLRLTSRVGTLPCPEWWDPAKTGSITFPEFRELHEYLLSIYYGPLNAKQKLRCYFTLLSWIRIHLRHMLKDVLIAADQMLYNLQAANSMSADLPTDRPISS